MMSPSSLLIFSFFLSLLDPSLARNHHVITLPLSSDLQPSALAWDPSAQHFLIGAGNRPVISSVSDAGVVQTLIPADSSSSSVSALAIDFSRRRLIAAFSSPATISSYDLRSPVPHRLIFSSPLPDPSSSVSGAAVDLATGNAFVSTSSGEIFTVDLDGKLSTLAQVSGGIKDVAHVNRGYLLALEKEKGQIFKVDAEDGAVKKVLISSSPAAETVAVGSDGTAVVAGASAARWVKSGDGWAEAAVYDEFRVEEGEKVKGVAIRERNRAYVLVVKEEEEEGYNGNEWKIEEVEWGKEGEGDLVWAMVLVGLGLAYFMYWRFQMGKLVTSINKKRA